MARDPSRKAAREPPRRALGARTISMSRRSKPRSTSRAKRVCRTITIVVAIRAIEMANWRMTSALRRRPPAICAPPRLKTAAGRIRAATMDG